MDVTQNTFVFLLLYILKYSFSVILSLIFFKIIKYIFFYISICLLCYIFCRVRIDKELSKAESASRIMIDVCKTDISKYPSVIVRTLSYLCHRLDVQQVAYWLKRNQLFAFILISLSMYIYILQISFQRTWKWSMSKLLPRNPIRRSCPGIGTVSRY